jgi:N-acetylmuramoyl-L-alanine amidase
MRAINKVIIHCSATPEGRYHDVDDIRRWHLARGWSDIGYHYVILLDGTIQAGRPVRRSGAHCRGQNSQSIGICYIGGTDALNSPKDTRTPEQRSSLKTLVSNLKRLHGHFTVHGHNEYSSKACPSFDVRTEL